MHEWGDWGELDTDEYYLRDSSDNLINIADIDISDIESF